MYIGVRVSNSVGVLGLLLVILREPHTKPAINFGMVISKVSAAPLYCLWSSYLGWGRYFGAHRTRPGITLHSTLRQAYRVLGI